MDLGKRIDWITKKGKEIVKVKLRYKFATQKVGSSIVAVAVEEDALKYNEILRMNYSGAFILEQLQEDISYAELVKQMLQKYDAEKATVEKILMDFLIMLSEKEILLDSKGELIKKQKFRKQNMNSCRKKI